MPKKFESKEAELSYYALHEWVKRHFGKATTCEICGNPKEFQCEWANISGEYKRERSDFMQLCQSCHRKKDHGDKCKKGHPYIGKNLVKRTDGYRQCRICTYEARARFREKQRNKRIAALANSHQQN